MGQSISFPAILLALALGFQSMNRINPTGRVVIAGGSGFLGLNLAKHLKQFDCETVLLSRNRPPDEIGAWKHVVWDAKSLGNWVTHLDGAAAVVNLAGRSVDCTKTPDHCDEILRSRVGTTELLGRAIRQVEAPPPVWIQMSTAHIYGDPPDVVCDEDADFGYGLAPFVGRAWEDTFNRSALPGMRKVILRTSFVLGRNGGALPRLVRLARCGLGGKAGHGHQGISWIHEDDMNRLFVRAIMDDSMRGAYLATAPSPVSNAQFMRELRRVLHVPIGLPATNWMVRIGAPLFMHTDPELALYGRYCVSRRLQAEKFDFTFADVRSALQDLFTKNQITPAESRREHRPIATAASL